ncbi:MAG: 5-formyltetrahydrofolate cyclo-ligase [Eubacterium sp.]|nr:5-formyltetrahydrofolate cyclo-ligase [Eubacterium sp.]
MQSGLQNKKEIRKRIREARNCLTEMEVEIRSDFICRRILSLPEYKEAESVLCYMAFRNEVDLKYIMSTSWQEEKKIYLPRMDAGTVRMEFYLHTPQDDLPVNAMGIREPSPDRPTFPELCKEGERVLMVMPGVVFDRERRRLGYGGGFYDRYLAEMTPDLTEKTSRMQINSETMIYLTTLAAAYELQLVKDPLPEEETDIRPDILVTEENIYR